jgi:putative thiamine transport system permease protein
MTQLQRMPPYLPRTGAAALLAVALLPLLWSLGAALATVADAAAWHALWQTPALWQAWAMSLCTGLAASVLSIAGTAVLLGVMLGPQQAVQGLHRRWMMRMLGPMLAVPHAAFAIGVVALVAPSGWVLRLLSPWATGWDAPPPWPTTQDPWGLGLTVVLVLKEIPFLLWAALAHLQRPDVARRLQQELAVARTLGYSATQAWWRVGWPQVAATLRAPMLAVLAYGLTVVDVALLIGPTTPPPLAVLAWQWLADAEATTNAQGAAAAWLLALTVAACAALGTLALHWMGWAGWGSGQGRAVRGVPAASRATATHAAVSAHGAWRKRLAHALGGWLLGVYALVLGALLLGSVTGVWPFPAVWPQAFTLAAWQSVWHSSDTLWATVWLALGSAAAALVWAVAWLETAPAAWQRRAQPLLMLPLVLPAVLWVLGLHQLTLAWGLDAQALGLWLAYTLACLPYVLLALQGPYRGFDGRLRHISATLGASYTRHLLRVKWPLLKAALAAAFAVGFAVSVAQYLPTLYVGAGRFATVTTEAVTLASGGQRSLSAAYAWLQWLLPVLVFALATQLGRARRFETALTRPDRIATPHH